MNLGPFVMMWLDFLAPEEACNTNRMPAPTVTPFRRFFYVDLNDLPVTRNGISPVMWEIIQELNQRHLDMRNPKDYGIHHGDGDANTVKRLRERFEEMGDCDLSTESVHVLSTLLRVYLRSLPTSLIPKEQGKQLATASEMEDGQQKTEKFRDIVQSMPVPHPENFHFLLRHLERIITLAEGVGRGDDKRKDLAKVYSKVLMRPKEDQQEKYADALEYILKHGDTMFVWFSNQK